MFRPGDNGFQKSTLTNDGFWPDLALDEFQRERSIPPTINEKTVVQAMLAAVAEINTSLASFTTQQKSKGYMTASAVARAIILLPLIPTNSAHCRPEAYDE